MKTHHRTLACLGALAALQVAACQAAAPQAAAPGGGPTVAKRPAAGAASPVPMATLPPRTGLPLPQVALPTADLSATQAEALALQLQDLAKLGFTAQRTQALAEGRALGGQGARLVAMGAGVIGNNGGSLIGNNAAGVIGNNGSSLIGNNAGGLIGNNAGGLIGNNAAGWRLLQSDAGASGGAQPEAVATHFAGLPDVAASVSLVALPGEEAVATEALPGGRVRLPFDAQDGSQRDVHLDGQGRVLEEERTSELVVDAGGAFLSGFTRRSLFFPASGQLRGRLAYRERHRGGGRGIEALEHLPSFLRDPDTGLDTRIEALSFDVGAQKGAFRLSYRHLDLLEVGQLTQVQALGPGASVVFDLADPLALHAGRSEVLLPDGQVAYQKEVRLEGVQQHLTLFLQGQLRLVLSRLAPSRFLAQGGDPPAWEGDLFLGAGRVGAARLAASRDGRLRYEVRPDRGASLSVEVRPE